MKDTNTDIYLINDSFFHKIFDNPENARDFLEYVSQTQDISRDQLKKMLDESKIEGGEIMPTLAQQMKEEFREELKEELKEEFMQTLGSQLKEEGKEETAKNMLKKGFDTEIIMELTGLKKEKIEKLASISP